MIKSHFCYLYKLFTTGMIKRRITVFVSAIAGLVFLLFTVLPHHHHHSQICFQNFHCQVHNDEAADNSLPGHKHDPKNEPDQCVLKLPCLLPSTNQIIIITGNEVSKLFSDSHFAFFDSSKQLHNIFFFPEVSPPGVLTFYTSLVNSSTGLRAPPSI